MAHKLSDDDIRTLMDRIGSSETHREAMLEIAKALGLVESK
jgi:hypothetical protein